MAWLIICFNILVPAGIILAHVIRSHIRSKQQDQGGDGDVSEAELEQLNHIFYVLDVDGSGALSVDEVATFVHAAQMR